MKALIVLLAALSLSGCASQHSDACVEAATWHEEQAVYAQNKTDQEWHYHKANGYRNAVLTDCKDWKAYDQPSATEVDAAQGGKA